MKASNGSKPTAFRCSLVRRKSASTITLEIDRGKPQRSRGFLSPLSFSKCPFPSRFTSSSPSGFEECFEECYF